MANHFVSINLRRDFDKTQIGQRIESLINDRFSEFSPMFSETYEIEGK